MVTIILLITGISIAMSLLAIATLELIRLRKNSIKTIRVEQNSEHSLK